MGHSIYYPHPPPPLWMSSGQNFTCRNQTSEMYPIGIDSKYLNPRNLDLFSKNLSIFYLHHLYRLAFVVILPVGIGLPRSTPVGIDSKYLNPRNLDLFSKNLSIYYLHHLYRLAFVVILPVGIGLPRCTPLELTVNI